MNLSHPYRFPTLLLLLFVLLASGGPVSAWRQWEYVNPDDLEITIKPGRTELPAGEEVSFTITVRNKTDKNVRVDFATGQRWDLATYHFTTQIWQYSNGMRWEEALHSIEIRPDRPEKFTLSWKTVDRVGMPLGQGDYKAQGMVTCLPRSLVSNMCMIRLLPPKNLSFRKDVIKVVMGQTFEIKVPRYLNEVEVDWRPDFDYNDNRIAEVIYRKSAQETTWVFRADRPGHVILHLWGYVPFRGQWRSKERRSWRVEVAPYD